MEKHFELNIFKDMKDDEMCVKMNHGCENLAFSKIHIVSCSPSLNVTVNLYAGK